MMGPEHTSPRWGFQTGTQFIHTGGRRDKVTAESEIKGPPLQLEEYMPLVMYCAIHRDDLVVSSLALRLNLARLASVPGIRARITACEESKWTVD